jgi:peptidyl-prolyl cis-trans isomerase A (cyclophilin A)
MKRRIALLSLIFLPLLAQCQTEDKKADPAAPAASKTESPQVKLKTSLGEIVIELNPAKAPLSTENFLSYVKKKHYDGTVFHRVISDFMIQGGGFAVDSGRLVEKPTGKPVKNESGNGLSNERGTIAMARTNDPHSATAQFFINVKNNANLDNYGGGYTVFGKVVKGMDVVDKIREVETSDAGMHQNVPKTPVVIESATVVE